jgi:hypothetical protein
MRRPGRVEHDGGGAGKTTTPRVSPASDQPTEEVAFDGRVGRGRQATGHRAAPASSSGGAGAAL